MVQLGWNAGPHHATIWGLAKSYDRKIDEETMAAHDEDILAAVSIFWGLVQVKMPVEVTSHVNSHLDAEGLPCMATRNVATGLSTSICLYSAI